MTDDLLEALLRAFREEASVHDHRALTRLVDGLRARAQLVLADRLAPVEAERDALADRLAAVEADREAVRAEKRTTAEAHDRLLAHHRATVVRLAEALESLAPGLPWSYRRVRARIAELVETLRKEAT